MRSTKQLPGLRRLLVHVKWIPHTGIWGMGIDQLASCLVRRALSQMSQDVPVTVNTCLSFHAVVLHPSRTHRLALRPQVEEPCHFGSEIHPQVAVADADPAPSVYGRQM